MYTRVCTGKSEEVRHYVRWNVIKPATAYGQLKLTDVGHTSILSMFFSKTMVSNLGDRWLIDRINCTIIILQRHHISQPHAMMSDLLCRCICRVNDDLFTFEVTFGPTVVGF